MTTRHLDALRALLAEPEVRVGAVISLATEFAIGLDALPDAAEARTARSPQTTATTATAAARRAKRYRENHRNGVTRDVTRDVTRPVTNVPAVTPAVTNVTPVTPLAGVGALFEGPPTPSAVTRHVTRDVTPVTTVTPPSPTTRSLADIVAAAVETGKAADEPPPRPDPPEWGKVLAKIAADDVPWLRTLHAEVSRVSVHEADQLGRMLWEALRPESGPRYRPEHITALHRQDEHRLIPRRVEGIRAALDALLREERLSAELGDSARAPHIARNFAGVYAAMREGRPPREDDL